MSVASDLGSRAALKAKLLGCASVLALSLVVPVSVAVFPSEALAQAQGVCGTFIAPNTIANPAVGNPTGVAAVACGDDALAAGKGAIAIGGDTNNGGVGPTANGIGSIAIGSDNLTPVQGALANADFAVAIGDSSRALGIRSIAIGAQAQANGTGGVAIGDLSVVGTNSVAVGAKANANALDATALGANTVAGPGATAVGHRANATGLQSVAIGQDGGINNPGIGALATGVQSTAIGTDAVASADNTTAVGAGAQANATGAAAFGTGAIANLTNEQMFGTKANTYTAPGITSALSSARQSGPLQIVTTDQAGHLASDGGSLFRAVARAEAGIAISLALEAPSLTERENFGIRLGYGNFDGESHAFGFSAMGVLCRGCFGPGDRVAIDGGIGIGSSDFRSYDSGNVVAGRVGIQWSWK